MLNYLGCLAVMGASVAVGLSYRWYREQVVLYMQALLDFIGKLEENVECYGRSISTWISNYKSPPLEESGFLERLRGKEHIGNAFDATKENMQLTEGAKVLIQELFYGYGGRNLETQILSLKQGLCRLEELIKNEKEMKDKSVRAVFAMSLGIAVGLCLLLS